MGSTELVNVHLDRRHLIKVAGGIALASMIPTSSFAMLPETAVTARNIRVRGGRDAPKISALGFGSLGQTIVLALDRTPSLQMLPLRKWEITVEESDLICVVADIGELSESDRRRLEAIAQLARQTDTQSVSVVLVPDGASESSGFDWTRALHYRSGSRVEAIEKVLFEAVVLVEELALTIQTLGLVGIDYADIKQMMELRGPIAFGSAMGTGLLSQPFDQLNSASNEALKQLTASMTFDPDVIAAFMLIVSSVSGDGVIEWLSHCFREQFAPHTDCCFFAAPMRQPGHRWRESPRVTLIAAGGQANG